MFDNPKKELEALEEQLLQNEAWFEKELESAKRMIGQTSQEPPRKQRPAAGTSQAPKALAKPAPQSGQTTPKAPKKKGVKGLLILAALEVLGILGLAGYWVLVLLK